MVMVNLNDASSNSYVLVSKSSKYVEINNIINVASDKEM